MQSLANISRHELEAKISNSWIRTMQMLYIAMALALAVMITVVAVFYTLAKERPMPEEPVNSLSLQYMVLALIFVALLEYMLFIILPKMRLAMGGTSLLSANLQNFTDRIPLLLSIYRSTAVIRLALLEGVAVFGLLIVLVAVTQFSIYTQSAYWLCLTPSVIFFAYIYLFFPTRERVIFYFENNFLNRAESGSV